ncbi:MAG TPA: alpha/beta hydrolase [Leptospiraceae bacterium]|nr:alpha/beta hydrolase [Leptospiraceae bacterium]HMW03671.1 alpha/beta hydrolase [Leptospiraceae bacterium]HMX31202.1 alpha/beta hydrolase [Leptospiraceae bacterium]HMY29408.1 alpha/beta hydrolase [Leptospiraceae bacterium]HMZ66608.1 alpha/beta hydrolase [Leptospiraceae bacterium]
MNGKNMQRPNELKQNKSKQFYLIYVIGLFTLTSCASTLVNTFVRYERNKASLTKKEIQVENHKIVYLEGGEGETILLIHGFGADKEHWTRMSRYLTDKYRVISPDLPPFGESTKLDSEDYGVLPQAKRVHLFTQALGLKKYHIVGNSMGGHIAGVYTSEYPDEVLSLALFDAAGVTSPNPSKLSEKLKEGKNPLIVSNEEEFDGLMKFSFVNPPYIPGFFKREVMKKAAANKPYSEKVFSKLMQDGNVLEKRLSKIKAKTLILWGDSDNIIDVSSVQVFEKGIVNHKTVILKECGHAPMIELPEESAKQYLNFIQN